MRRPCKSGHRERCGPVANQRPRGRMDAGAAPRRPSADAPAYRCEPAAAPTDEKAALRTRAALNLEQGASVQHAGRHAAVTLALPFPGADRHVVDAGIMETVAQVDEVALRCLEIDLDPVFLRGFQLRGGEALESCRHLGIGERHGHGPENRRELFIEVASDEIAHLYEIPVGML